MQTVLLFMDQSNHLVTGHAAWISTCVHWIYYNVHFLRLLIHTQTYGCIPCIFYRVCPSNAHRCSCCKYLIPVFIHSAWADLLLSLSLSPPPSIPPSLPPSLYMHIHVYILYQVCPSKHTCVLIINIHICTFCLSSSLICWCQGIQQLKDKRFVCGRCSFTLLE